MMAACICFSSAQCSVFYDAGFFFYKMLSHVISRVYLFFETIVGWKLNPSTPSLEFSRSNCALELNQSI